MQIGVDCQLAVGTRRIFVLDGDDIGRMAVQFMLHDEYETHELSSLENAVSKAQEWPPDLVILGEDLWTDPEILESARDAFPGARFLLVGDPDSESARAVLASGMPLIDKPLRLETVRSRVAAALSG